MLVAGLLANRCQLYQGSLLGQSDKAWPLGAISGWNLLILAIAMARPIALRPLAKVVRCVVRLAFAHHFLGFTASRDLRL